MIAKRFGMRWFFLIFSYRKTADQKILQDNKGKRRKCVVEVDEKLCLPFDVQHFGTLYFADVFGWVNLKLLQIKLPQTVMFILTFSRRTRTQIEVVFIDETLSLSWLLKVKHDSNFGRYVKKSGNSSFSYQSAGRKLRCRCHKRILSDNARQKRSKRKVSLPSTTLFVDCLLESICVCEKLRVSYKF